MEEDKSKSQSPHEDSYVSPEFLVLLAENAEGLREGVEDILEEMKQDGNFSEMTDELYDQKKSYLTRYLTELSRMHKVLADQISSTVRYSTPIGLYFALSRDSTVLCVSNTEDSKSSFSLSLDSGSESTISTNKLLISPVNDDARKDKETKAPEVLLQKNFNSYDLGNEKEVADLKHALSVSNLKNKKMGIELEASKKKGAVSDIVIKDLKQQRSNQDSKGSQMEQELQSLRPLLDYATKQAHSHGEKIHEFEGQLSLYKADIAERENQITELNNKNKQYTSDISQLKSTHKTKENNWRNSIGKLRKELEVKGETVDDLTKKLDNVQAEKCSQENLVQELETRLNSLQTDHVGVLVSFDIAQIVTNELTERVLELEREVDMQREVISAREGKL